MTITRMRVGKLFAKICVVKGSEQQQMNEVFW